MQNGLLYVMKMKNQSKYIFLSGVTYGENISDCIISDFDVIYLE